MRLQSLDGNESHVNMPWKNNDEETVTLGALHDGASRYHSFAAGNSRSKNKPDKAQHAHCQDRAEKRRDVRFSYKRDDRYRKPNISGSREGGDPRRGKEEKVELFGQALEDANRKMTHTEEGRKCTVSNQQCDAEDRKDPPTEDMAIGQMLNDDEPKGKQGTGSKVEATQSFHEKGAEHDCPRLENVVGLLEDAKDSDNQTSMHTVKTSEAIGPSLRMDSNLECEDNTALNCDQSETSYTVDVCSVKSRHMEDILENQETSSNIGNVIQLLKSGDFKAEEEAVVGVKMEDVGEHSQSPNEDLVKELLSCLGSSISIEQPQSDYSTYLSGESQTYDVDFGHIIEIYDFPPHVKTEDIQEAFANFRDKGFRVKWVDSSHALGIFSSPDSASEALSISHEQFKMQPLSQASKQSKLKVSRCSEFLQPVKERAQVNTAIAKRLVSRALGFQTAECRRRPDPKSKKTKENRVQLHKAKDDANNTLNSGAEQT